MIERLLPVILNVSEEPERCEVGIEALLSAVSFPSDRGVDGEADGVFASYGHTHVNIAL